MIYDLETILNAIVCRARQAKGFLKNGSEAENRIAVEELKKDIDELLKSHTLKGAPNMKTYTVRYTMNNFGFHRRLEDEYRKEYSFRVTCSNLVELFTIVNGFIHDEDWNYYYRELVAIEER